jgi:hypothetical protein
MRQKGERTYEVSLGIFRTRYWEVARAHPTTVRPARR